MKNFVACACVCMLISSLWPATSTAATQTKRPVAPWPAIEDGDELLPALAWLGPMPKPVSQAALRDLSYKTAIAIRNDLGPSTDYDLLNFRCLLPHEVGPVPLMAAVDDFIDFHPESAHDPAIVAALAKSAQQGNWLARLQLYTVLSARRSGSTRLLYRTFQLQAWLQKNQVGGLYALLNYDLAASGYPGSPGGADISGFDIFAAMHHGYPSQHKVGTALAGHDNPRHVEVGKKMLDCAANSIPSYARIFNGEARKAREARARAKIESGYTPLIRAVGSGDISAVEALLSRPGTDVNGKTDRGLSAIGHALMRPHPDAEIVNLLIRHGADVAHHGTVDPDEYEKHDLLNLAVQLKPVNLALIKMLVDAGADPFQVSEANPYVSQTPFADAFSLFDSGEAPAILEYFLGTGKLAPRSAAAAEYLNRAAPYPRVLKRLLAYGIWPEQSGNLLNVLVESGHIAQTGSVEERIAITDSLLKAYPEMERAVRGEAGHAALRQAVGACQFAFANFLVDAGAPVAGTGSTDGAELVSLTVAYCDGSRLGGLASAGGKKLISDRSAFLRKLTLKRVSFNVKNTKGCQAWLGPDCEIPATDELALDFLAGGADAYRRAPEQRDTGLSTAIKACRTMVVERILAKPPVRYDMEVEAGLNWALQVSGEDMWAGTECPSDFIPTVSAKLRQLGAKDE